MQGGRVDVVTQGEIDRLPVRLPMVEMRTIGAGGGSIAAVDAWRAARRSGRAAPARGRGRSAYGRGGTEPTVTDANLALGRLDPDYFLGGADEARHAGDAGGDRGEGRRAARARGGAGGAGACSTVTNANLGAAVRLALFEKGLDPREFSLLSFGGAGGLHATDVAAEMGIREVIFPREPGTLSAYGILYSDLVQDLARSAGCCAAVPASLPAIARAGRRVAARGERAAGADGVAPERRELARRRRHALPRPGIRAGGALERRRWTPWRCRLLGALPRDAPAALLLRRSEASRWRSSPCALIATGRLPKPDAAERRTAARPALKGTPARLRGRRLARDADLGPRGAAARAASPDRRSSRRSNDVFATPMAGSAAGWTATLGAAGALDRQERAS